MHYKKEICEQLDLILTECVEWNGRNGRVSFPDRDIKSRTAIDDPTLLNYLIGLLENESYYGRDIIQVFRSKTGTSIKINSDTIQFVKNGGFTKRFEEVEIEKAELKKIKDLEIANLELGPKQYEFNKRSVVINTILTVISITAAIVAIFM